MSERMLDGRVAVITGASRGLGRAMAVALAAAGAKTALVGRDREALETTAAAVRETGSETGIFIADVSSEADVLRIQSEIGAQFANRVDILINNAGINIRKPVTDFTLEEWNRVMGSNVTSAFLMCRSFVPMMKGRGYGRIINMTSIMSHVSIAERTAYSSSKAALLGMTKALAMELASEGICAVGISPGPFATEMNIPLMNDAEKNRQFLSKIPVGRWGKVEEIGQLAVYLCSDVAGFITGTDILIDGGWTAQ